MMIPLRFLPFTTCFCLLLIGNASLLAQIPLFKLISSKESDLKFVNSLNDKEDLNVMAYEYFYNGGGVAVGDINNDGLEDLFLTSNMGENKLYLNLGNLKFKDITKHASKELQGRKGGWKTGVSMADVNGDGLLDIYICYSGKVEEQLRKNQLFINLGVGDGVVKFEEQAEKYGLAAPSYSTQAAFFDYDQDGDLDMFLLNHSVKKIDNLELAKFRQQTDELAGNKLFENRNNHFVNVTELAGIKQFPLTFGLGLAIADVNQDGWQDIYVTNDYNEPDYLYINQKNGTFEDVSKTYFRHMAQFSMGVDIADYNNDGLPDLISLDMLPEDNRRQKLLQLQENYEAFELMTKQDLHRQYMRNMLQLNNGNGTFSEIAQLAGVSNTDWSWSPLLADFDNDGYKDLFVSNGYYRDYTNKDFLRYWGDYKIRKAIDREPMKLMDLVQAMPSTRIANYIFKNNRDLTFSNQQQEWGLTHQAVSAGAVYADLDNDGDLDLIINNINEEVFLYENQQNVNGNQGFMQVVLKQNQGNTNCIGAKVSVYSRGLTQYQEVNPSRGYLSSMSSRLHFGLGAGQFPVDSVVVIWPDMQKQVHKGLAINQQHVLFKDPKGGTKRPNRESLSATSAESMVSMISSPIQYIHQGFDENDFKRQPLMLSMYSQTGPILAQGDVNKDGLADVYVSGHSDRQAKIWIQGRNGEFSEMPGFSVGDENESTNSAALFFDANGDGYDDLYLAKGGYGLVVPNTLALQDELYLNDGKGALRLSVLSLPNLKGSSKSCLRPADFDGDGDLDLFVGGRIIPGRYPENPKSYLLVNKGNGTFEIAPTPFSEIGMITDAQWGDVNADGRPDLVLAGEYMPIKIYHNLISGFEDATTHYFEKEMSGIWSSLTLADVNGDGQLDLLGGNMGLNSQVKASQEQPAMLYYADFDENGSIDPFFTFYIQGKPYPFVSRDELNDQMFGMRKKFRSYQDYSDAGITDILSPELMKKAKVKTVNTLETQVFIRQGERFIKKTLPIEAQFAPVTALVARDINQDGKVDLLLFGNKSANRLKIGSIDANYGFMLLGDGKGGFDYVPQTRSGINVQGDVKSVIDMTVAGKNIMLIGAFDHPIQALSFK
ncbi:VCBS repeat-containing protein [Dyadobacter tibetensis]|uniref:VCBS repeat-containing protein n=1 Tax=Dyadobacter tibetensis TaxID=1211851 RepID=UPI00047278AC|nr:VCBS repeat-containing protein [Dyadobacter tibetensis]